MFKKLSNLFRKEEIKTSDEESLSSINRACSSLLIEVALSDKNFDALLSSEHDIYLQEGAATAGIVVLSLHLFPFFVAYSKGRINKNQFESAVKKFVPEITTKTLNRIIMLTLMGPIFGWFLLASFILKISTHESDTVKDVKQLVYKPLV